MINGWCFAIVNGKLAEIFFHNDYKNRKSKIFGYCYLEDKEYKTKREQEQINKDISKYNLLFEKGKYSFQH